MHLPTTSPRPILLGETPMKSYTADELYTIHVTIDSAISWFNTFLGLIETDALKDYTKSNVHKMFNKAFLGFEDTLNLLDTLLFSEDA